MNYLKILRLLFVILLAFQLQAQKLSQTEKKIIKQVEQNQQQAIDLLEKVVNINSGSLNIKGVKKVGAIFADEFKAIGFTPTWFDMPESMGRAGHLFCELKTGTIKGKRLLLIGHLDTVFEENSPFQNFTRDSTLVYGPGVDDMKGGDIIILFALKALRDAGVLNNTQIIAAFSGDEEKAGNPTSLSRKDLVDAAKRSDIALGFEGATGLNYATVARRSAGSWKLETTGVRAHSAGVFTKNVGAGAIYELARILNAFYNELPEENLTFNVATAVGGTQVTFDDEQSKGATFGKTNIVPQTAIASGDIRCLTEDQINNTVAKMKAIVAKNLPHTTAKITFDLEYPAMAPTPGNYAVLKVLDDLSQALKQGPVLAFDPAKRGAGDISFVAKYVDALDGLGTMGGGSHTTKEFMELDHFNDLTKRAALLIYRLINTKS